jgi:hypothetical protein
LARSTERNGRWLCLIRARRVAGHSDRDAQHERSGRALIKGVSSLLKSNHVLALDNKQATHHRRVEVDPSAAAARGTLSLWGIAERLMETTLDAVPRRSVPPSGFVMIGPPIASASGTDNRALPNAVARSLGASRRTSERGEIRSLRDAERRRWPVYTPNLRTSGKPVTKLSVKRFCLMDDPPRAC